MQYTSLKRLSKRTNEVTSSEAYFQSIGKTLKFSELEIVKPNLLILESKLGFNPNCPICLGLSEIHEKENGFFALAVGSTTNGYGLLKQDNITSCYG